MTRHPWICAFIAALAAALLYLPTLTHPFLEWDDMTFIVNNPLLKSLTWDNLRGMFFYDRGSYWQPLALFTQAIDWKLGGGSPFPFHLGNLLLHTANTFLVFWLSLKLFTISPGARTPISNNIVSAGDTPRNVPRTGGTGGELPAFLAALLFGLHPLHVESVAWAVERKDVLYSFFFLASVLLYMEYVLRTTRRGLWYSASLAVFALSLASKPMAVTLPLVLLALDAWPLDRLRSNVQRVLGEKLPFLFLSLPVMVTAMTFSKRIDTMVVDEVPYSLVVANAFRTVWVYLGQTLLPLGLSPLNPYPLDRGTLYASVGVLAVVGVVGVTIAVLRKRRHLPSLPVAWFSYLVILLPALGLARIGSRTAAHADRYAYLASLVPILLASFLLSRWASKDRARFVALAATLTVLLGAMSFRQIGYWKDTESLWKRVTAVHPDSHLAHSNLAAFLSATGRLAEALTEYDRAVALPPPQAVTRNGRAGVLFKLGRFEESAADYETAMTMDPSYVSPRRNLWAAYTQLGRHEDALDAVQSAVKIDPGQAEDSNRMGSSFLALKKWGSALASFESALYLKPQDPRYMANRALALSGLGRLQAAAEILEKCVMTVPDEPAFHTMLGDVYKRMGRAREAREQFEAIRRLGTE